MNNFGRLVLAVLAFSFFGSANLAMATPPPWDVRGEDSVDLPENTNQLGVIEGSVAEVVAIVSRCPARTPRCRSLSYTTVKLQFVPACTNDVVVAGTKFDEVAPDKFRLTVTALELKSPTALVARCAAPNIKMVEVPLPMAGKISEDHLEVVFTKRLYGSN